MKKLLNSLLVLVIAFSLCLAVFGCTPTDTGDGPGDGPGNGPGDGPGDGTQTVLITDLLVGALTQLKTAQSLTTTTVITNSEYDHDESRMIEERNTTVAKSKLVGENLTTLTFEKISEDGVDDFEEYTLSESNGYIMTTSRYWDDDIGATGNWSEWYSDAEIDTEERGFILPDLTQYLGPDAPTWEEIWVAIKAEIDAMPDATIEKSTTGYEFGFTYNTAPEINDTITALVSYKDATIGEILAEFSGKTEPELQTAIEGLFIDGQTVGTFLDSFVALVNTLTGEEISLKVLVDALQTEIGITTQEAYEFITTRAPQMAGQIPAPEASETIYDWLYAYADLIPMETLYAMLEMPPAQLSAMVSGMIFGDQAMTLADAFNFALSRYGFTFDYLIGLTVNAYSVEFEVKLDAQGRLTSFGYETNIDVVNTSTYAVLMRESRTQTITFDYTALTDADLALPAGIVKLPAAPSKVFNSQEDYEAALTNGATVEIYNPDPAAFTVEIEGAYVDGGIGFVEGNNSEYFYIDGNGNLVVTATFMTQVALDNAGSISIIFKDTLGETVNNNFVYFGYYPDYI